MNFIQTNHTSLQYSFVKPLQKLQQERNQEFTKMITTIENNQIMLLIASHGSQQQQSYEYS